MNESIVELIGFGLLCAIAGGIAHWYSMRYLVASALGASVGLVGAALIYTYAPDRNFIEYTTMICVAIAIGSPLVVGIPIQVWKRRCVSGPGHCGKCGYDLTKNESGVCPECGREIPGVVE